MASTSTTNSNVDLVDDSDFLEQSSALFGNTVDSVQRNWSQTITSLEGNNKPT